MGLPTVTRLPTSLSALAGLKGARWIRESTDRQSERFGPDAQRDQQDRAIARYGIADTGLSWQIAHSGRTIATTADFAAMLAAAGSGFDVLLVGYVSRFARDLRTAVNARHDLHAAGAALLFCDERVLSSDESAWELWAREAVEAEAYSRRLGRRVAEGYGAKFRRHADPGGNAPLGFRRVDSFLEVDPDTIGRVVEVFREYSTGRVSLAELALRHGIDFEALKMLLRNPVYNGWVLRHRRSPDEQMLPAAWRDAPPVDDALWERVQQVRADRYTGGGRSTRRHVHLLAGLVHCVCGARIRAEASTKAQRWVMRRYRHREPCEAWSGATKAAATFEGPISAQVRQLRLGSGLMVSLRALAATTATPGTGDLRRGRIERDLATLAARHAKRAIATDHYLAEHARLTALLDQMDDEPDQGAPIVEPDRAVAWLGDIKRLWGTLDDEGRRDLANAIYGRVRVTSDGIVDVSLTPEALRHGAALALPETVAMVRPEGFQQRRATQRVPILERREWLRMVRSA